MLKARILPFLAACVLLVGCSSSRPATSPGSTPAETTQARAPDPDTSTAPDTTDTTSTSSAQAAEESKAAGERRATEERTADTGPREPTPDRDDEPDLSPTVEESILEEAPEDWQHRSTGSGEIPGIGTAEAYADILNGRQPRQTVIVAVIDSGVDIEHDDLDDNIWTNDDEIAGNGVDDDKNGYVDDVHGWNFIGGPDGENIDHAPMELTRIVREYRAQFAGTDSASVAPNERDAFQRYQTLKAKLDRMRRNKQQEFGNVRNNYEAMRYAAELLKDALGTDSLTVDGARQVTSPRRDLQQARDIYVYFAENGVTLQDFEDYLEDVEEQLRYGYNLDYDPRSIVGDDPEDLDERFYGNNDVEGPDARHGTHVAGIIAGERDNGFGMDGVATNTKIMVLRAVPNGDERDKDVANAIRYAADNGAHVINMSFGKDYSPNKIAVDRAVRYADSLGVLMVHAAGNDGANIDTTDNFPTDVYLDGGSPERWITVGASSWEGATKLAASFSNYGPQQVDLFAPGVDIYSTTPGQTYERIPGTSMAAPMVSGVAALVMAFYPELSALDVRRIVLDTVTPFPKRQVVVPGGDTQVPFASLSVTGGIVNVAEALRRAEEIAPTP